MRLKPEDSNQARYSDQMGEKLDLLVMGGWWGKGGRTGKISSLLCGLRVPQDDDGTGETPTWVDYVPSESDAEWTMQFRDVRQDWVRDELLRLRMDIVSEYGELKYAEYLRNKHKDHWKPFVRVKPPPWMQLGPTGTDDKRALAVVKPLKRS